ncbi:MAG: 3-hydroxyacyl-ACP dehydratase FabZ [Candidatus Limnocylindria bacterium]|nr:3-hydroxyacyl-ACP dehydratase FabZ [Candidatus Limnocylindria bacterium]
MSPLDRKGIEALIPHREPFLLIDRVTELEPGVRAVAEHTFTGDEWYQPGHFPGNPIVPGVILVESMAQTATVMAMSMPEYRDGLGLFAGIEEMRFKRMVKPGDVGRFEAVIEKMRRGFARVNVKTFVGDELAAEGVILAVFQPTTPGTPAWGPQKDR